MTFQRKRIGFKKTLIITLILVLISPLFGVILADMVGYHEPLDVAAESINLPDLTETINWTPLLDYYTASGLTAEVGYIIAGFIGIGLLLGIGLVLNRLVGRHQG